MNVRDLQIWLNQHGAMPTLVTDGIGGAKTRNAIYQVFTNKNAAAITETQMLDLAKSLGDTTTKRIKAVAKVESGGSGWLNSGLPKILYERHYFYKLNKQTVIKWLSFGFLSDKSGGGYTTDINNNGINDSWEKLAAAACINPDAAFQSISIGKFQVMGAHYRMLGFNHPIEMLYAATRNEHEHYKMLVGYIKGTNLTKAFLSLSTNPKTCEAFARGYNGPAYKKYAYDTKLANTMK